MIIGQLVAAVVSSAVSGGGGESGQAPGGDAFKGDGPQGIGAFLEGVGKAYGITNTNIASRFDRLDPVDKQRLINVLDRMAQEFLTSVFTKGDAKTDSKEAVDAIFKTHRDKNLPVIYAKQCAAGLYNCTASQLMANDAYSSAVVKGAEIRLGWIQAYAQTHLQEGANTTQILNVLTQVYEAKTSDTHVANRPDIDTFGSHAGKFLIFMGVLDWVSRRKYFADDGKDQSVGGLIGGAITGAIGNIT